MERKNPALNNERPEVYTTEIGEENGKGTSWTNQRTHGTEEERLINTKRVVLMLKDL